MRNKMTKALKNIRTGRVIKIEPSLTNSEDDEIETNL